MGGWIVLSLVALLLIVVASPLGATGLNALWTGRAHFEKVGDLDWSSAPSGGSNERAGWFVAHDSIWYVFNRVTLSVATPDCPADHTSVVVRQSRNRGKTWSAPTSVVVPGESLQGDGCAVLDGSTFYDQDSDTWHLVAQCLARGNVGGWSLCHYSRQGRSPVGRFMPDLANPVVRGGALWSRICAGKGKACPPTTRDEGTPDIIEKRAGRFVMSFHGYDYASRTSYRGIAATADFHQWTVGGIGLPNDALLGPADCRSWLPECAGTGEATTLLTSAYAYSVVETMTKGLTCTTDQKWVFQLIRTPRSHWSRSGTGAWQRLPGVPLLTPANYDPKTVCQVQYARWLQDGSDIYLMYEDAAPGRMTIRRRVLHLVSGGGRAVLVR